MKIVLASGSPRRRELLTGLGLKYTVLVSGVEEQVTENEPARVVEELPCQKARDVLQRLLREASGQGPDMRETEKDHSRREDRFWDGREELLVIGADTVVAADGQKIRERGGGDAGTAVRQTASGIHWRGTVLSQPRKDRSAHFP